MFKSCISTILVGILIFIVVVGIILLIAIGLHYVLQYIPCEILVYIETGLLLGVFMLVAMLIASPKINLMKMFEK